MNLKYLKLFLLSLFSLTLFISCGSKPNKDSRNIMQKADLNTRMNVITDESSNNKYLGITIKNGTDKPIINCIFRYKYGKKEITVSIDKTLLKDEEATGRSLEPLDKNFDITQTQFIDYKVTFIENNQLGYCTYTGSTEGYTCNLVDITESELDLIKNNKLK